MGLEFGPCDLPYELKLKFELKTYFLVPQKPLSEMFMGQVTETCLLIFFQPLSFEQNQICHGLNLFLQGNSER